MEWNHQLIQPIFVKRLCDAELFLESSNNIVIRSEVYLSLFLEKKFWLRDVPSKNRRFLEGSFVESVENIQIFHKFNKKATLFLE